MRSILGARVALAVSLCLAACASPSESAKHRGQSGDANASGDNGTAASSTGATGSALACPTGLPAAEALLAGIDASDVRIAAGSVWFRTNTGVDRIEKDGTRRVEVVASLAIVRSLVDETSILTVEMQEDVDDSDPQSVIRAFSLDGHPTFATTQPWAPSSVQLVGSDAESFYVQAIDQDGQDTVQRIDRTSGTATVLVTFGNGLDDIITDPQVVGPDLWVVRGAKRVFKIRIAATDNDGNFKPSTPEAPLEIFGSASEACRLAVASDAIYCGAGKQIVRRDISGANATVIFDTSSDPAPVAVGLPMFVQGSLVTMPGSDQQTSPLRAVIRAMHPAAAKVDAKILACGRGTVTDVAADTMSVAWAELGTSKGLYIAAR